MTLWSQHTVPDGVTHEDVATTWAPWVAAAHEMGEADVAVDLLDSSPGPVPDALRAEVLARAGRWSELAELLTSAEVAPPAGDGAIESNQVLLAAAHAGLGDAGALRWLTEHTTRCADDGVRTEMLRLLLSVSETTGNRAIADEAVHELAELGLPLTPLDEARYAAARLAAAHDRNASARVIAERILSVNAQLERTGILTGVGSAVLLEAVRRLGAHEPSAARLLLRAAQRCSRPDPEVSRAMASMTPGHLRYRLLGVGILVVVLGLVVLGFLSGEPGIGTIVALAASALWHRGITLPGLTLSETRLWRDLGRLRYDPESQQVRNTWSDRAGVYCFVGIIASQVGVGLSLWLTAYERPWLGEVDVWMRGEGMLLVWVTVTGVLTAGAVLALRTTLRVLDRTRAAARLHAEAHRARVAAGMCRCWSLLGVRGPEVDTLASNHLVPVDPQPFLLTRLGRAPAARVARCPSTGVLWALDLPGALGARLALRGVAPSATSPRDTAVGMYL